MTLMKNDHDVIVNRHERKPTVLWDELLASTSEQVIHPRIHTALVHAIQDKHFVTLTLRTHTEVSGEPHIYGERAGQPTLLLYNDEAEPKWRLVDARQVHEVKLWLDEHFTKRELPPEFDPDNDNHAPAGE